MNTDILPRTTSPVNYRRNNGREYIRRTDKASFERQVQLSEQRQRRLEVARQTTATFTGNDDGDIFFM